MRGWHRIGYSELSEFEKRIEIGKLVALVCAGFWTFAIYLQNAGREEAELERIRNENNQFKDGALYLSADIEIKRIDKRTRAMKVVADYENRGKVTAVVGAVIIEWYVGRIDNRLPTQPVLHLNPPRSGPRTRLATADGTEPTGTIKWEPVGYRACRHPNSAPPIKGYIYEVGGCGTNPYKPGIGGHHVEEFVIRAKNVQFVGATISAFYGPPGTQEEETESVRDIGLAARVN